MKPEKKEKNALIGKMVLYIIGIILLAIYLIGIVLMIITESGTEEIIRFVVISFFLIVSLIIIKIETSSATNSRRYAVAKMVEKILIVIVFAYLVFNIFF